MEFNEIFFQIEYKDINSAHNALSKNKVWSVLSFGKNFTHSLIERIEGGLYYTSNETITLSNVDVWMDMSSMYSNFN